MLWAAKTLRGMGLEARDGRVGEVADLFFDDKDWAVRYLVADTGHWLTGRTVLLSPHVLGKPDPSKRMIQVDLRREQVENAPTPDTDPPVSRQFERLYNDYYGFPYYWLGPYVWGGNPVPHSPPVPPHRGVAPPTGQEDAKRGNEAKEGKSNPHLHSAEDSRGYHVRANDGEIGNIEDFLVDGEDWRIRYLVVDTINWMPSKAVVVPVEWEKEINWEGRKIAFDHARDEVRNAPIYKRGMPLSRVFEEALDEYFRSAALSR